jgi:hypothetical protein
MAAPTFNYPSVFQYFSMISPFMVVLLFVLISIINSNLKGMIYLLGIMLLFIIVLLFQKVFHTLPDPNKHPYCNMFAMTPEINGIPSFNSAIFLFTFIYLFLPMFLHGIMNFPLMVILLSLYAVDVVMKTRNRCTSPSGVVMGSMVGLIWGFTWYYIIKSQNQELLYYDDLISNKVACSRPTQQQFKCSVYKNGELLKTL